MSVPIMPTIPSFISRVIAVLPSPIRRLLRIQIVRFLGFSGLCTILDYSLVAWGTSVVPPNQFSIGLVIAISFALVITIHFLLCRKFVFPPSRHRFWVEYAFVASIAMVGLALTEVIVLVLYARYHLHVLIGKTVSLVVVFGWNYLARRYLIYRSVTEKLCTVSDPQE